jgi:hypothetical protein
MAKKGFTDLQAYCARQAEIELNASGVVLEALRRAVREHCKNGKSLPSPKSIRKHCSMGDIRIRKELEGLVREGLVRSVAGRWIPNEKEFTGEK